jgi:L-amino acid N-acyltransferase YncA
MGFISMKIRIRSVEPADAEVIHAIYAPFVSDTVISFETIVPDVAEIRSRIEAHAESCPWLVCEGDQCVMGYAYASPHRTRPAYRWSVDVSVYVDPRHHRRGIGRALYTSLFDLLRRQGFINAYAGIALPNPSSVALHESLGFESVGTFRGVGFKFGRWHDVLWLHLRLREVLTPSVPLSTRSLWNDPNVADVLSQSARAVSLD